MECIEGLRTPDRGTITDVLVSDPFRQVYKLQERIGVGNSSRHNSRKRIKVWEAVDLWARLPERKAIDGAHLTRAAWPSPTSGTPVYEPLRRPERKRLVYCPWLITIQSWCTRRADHGADPAVCGARSGDLVRGMRESGQDSSF